MYLFTPGMAKVDICSVSCIKDQTDLNKSTVNAAAACLGDTAIKMWIFRESIPDVHILNVAVGSTPDLDHANTILMKCNDQIDLVCKMIQVSWINNIPVYVVLYS